MNGCFAILRAIGEVAGSGAERAERSNAGLIVFVRRYQIGASPTQFRVFLFARLPARSTFARFNQSPVPLLSFHAAEVDVAQMMRRVEHGEVLARSAAQ
jgi:hypothetical protein